MPNYKMVDADALDGAMLETAKAIREKGGTEELIPWNKSTGYKEAIEAIKGGGGGLNFTVVGGAAQPENPAENTIWVSTSVEIGKWTIAGREPESATHGDVWFKLLANGNTIEALAENSLLFAINTAYQYIDGDWNDVDAKIYRDGGWETALSSLVIYNGSWLETRGFETNGSVSINNDAFPAVAALPSSTASNNTAYVEIDVTGYTTLNIEFEYDPEWGYVAISTDKNWYDKNAYYCVSYKRFDGVAQRQSLTLPINGATGVHYLKIYGWGRSAGTHTFKLYSLYLK